MLEKAKLALRIKTSAFDGEILDLIQAAQADMGLIGIAVDPTDPLISRAVITYVRLHFGSPEDYDRLKLSYDEQKAQLQGSSRYREVTP